MTTVSIPLPDEMLRRLKSLVNEGAGENLSQLARKAIYQYLENEAVEAVLRASKEPRLEGDLDELAAKL